MNTARVKNLIIVLLIVVNLALGVLIINQESRYQMSGEQEEAIQSILSKNFIGVYALIPREFRPMKTLQMQLYEFDEEALVRVAMPDAPSGEITRVEVTAGRSVVQYSHEGVDLLVEPGRFVYMSQSGYATPAFLRNPAGQAEMRALCDSFISQFATPQMAFTYDNTVVYREDGYTMIEYRGTYKGQILYTNYVRCKVTADGITELRCAFSTPDGFVGAARDIYACDEALLSLLGTLKSIYGDSGKDAMIIIRKIDKVYYLEDSGAMKAVPYYRVYTDGAIEVPFFINAYNNTVLR